MRYVKQMQGKAYRGIFVHWQRLISSINKKDN
ncbi:hypothetical protein EcE24377A_0141 [Escherichia coli O139:H28 str. E24377A]|uniref:Uncharacterized protein n=1 Tax=Escherichia coli O139:H28 (strain E24377A / ETEC) TaxID=331111 RepID=A7ZHM8_ECO24|nr:hypothetical protein EcE24377A_0141 [Escherichia coli O139:H28 str. E24377A]